MFKIRCSAIGKIMAYPDKDKLPVGAITYADEWHLEQKYGRRQIFVTDQVQKGIMVEEQSITLLTDHTNVLYRKNKENLYNEWLTGTPDIVNDDFVVDIKSAWDFWSFHKAEGVFTKSGLLTDYGWQLMGYMMLTGKKKAMLAYCLVNTPTEMVMSMEYSARWKFQGLDENPDYDKYCEELRKLHTFDDMPKEERVRLWNLAYDEERIQQLKSRVELVRKYLKEVYND